MAKMRLGVGKPAAGYVVLVIVAAVSAACVVLMLLVSVAVVLVVLIVLKGLAQVHGNTIALVARTAIVHHHIVALMCMPLVEHVERLRGLRPGRTRG